MGEASKVPENRDRGIGLNGSVKKEIVAVFLASTLVVPYREAAQRGPG